VVAIVLAGGASSRFGTDKLAADLDGRPLLHHALEAVAAVADRIVVVVAPEAPLPSVPSELAARVSVARDAEAFGGPLAGLVAGLAALSGLADPEAIALVVGGDMPWLVPEVLALLVDVFAADPVLGAATLEADPPSALPMAIRPSQAVPSAVALLAENRRALRGLLRSVPSVVVSSAAWRAVDLGGRTLRDIDAPEDLPRR
jgi:molybdopterin-guanine dinucleotide biosynthesis protein A